MNVGIRGDVLTIVQDDETSARYRAVKRDGRACEQNAENGIQLSTVEEISLLREAFLVAASCGIGHVLSREFGRGSFRLPYREAAFFIQFLQARFDVGNVAGIFLVALG